MKLHINNSLTWYNFSETGLYKNCLNGRRDKFINTDRWINNIEIFKR